MSCEVCDCECCMTVHLTFSTLTLLVGRLVVKTQSGGVLLCLVRDAVLHMTQMMPLSLTVSCFTNSKLVLFFWYQLALVIPDKGPLN